MWLVTSIGFFSVVQKTGDDMLTVRARVAADLDHLRLGFLPSLGATVTDAGTDYPYRARVRHADLAAAMARLVRDVDYPNFKDAVARAQGHARAKIYHQVWSALAGLEERPAARGRRRAYGGVVIAEDGRVLLRRPRDDHDGYVWTFAKGGAAPGESAEQAALREVRQETGVEAAIVGELPGWFDSGASATRFFVMRPVRDTGHFDHETSAVIWVDVAEARARIGETRNARGRARDLAVLDALAAYRGDRGAIDR